MKWIIIFAILPLISCGSGSGSPPPQSDQTEANSAIDNQPTSVLDNQASTDDPQDIADLPSISERAMLMVFPNSWHRTTTGVSATWQVSVLPAGNILNDTSVYIDSIICTISTFDSTRTNVLNSQTVQILSRDYIVQSNTESTGGSTIMTGAHDVPYLYWRNGGLERNTVLIELDLPGISDLAGLVSQDECSFEEANVTA